MREAGMFNRISTGPQLTNSLRFPRLWYDSSCQLATVIAAPTPLHSDMVGELVDHFADTCRDVMRRGGISENIWEGLTVSSATTNRKNTDDGLTIREWDGAISYVVNDDPKLMVAFEVGVSQTYKSLQAAISWCVCALHCRLGIAMNITEKDRGERPTVKYYASRQEQGTAIQHARNEFRLQLRRNPFGPLEWNNITWFGKLREVIIETFRNEDPNCPPEALLEPTQSFVSDELCNSCWMVRLIFNNAGYRKRWKILWAGCPAKPQGSCTWRLRP
jgi:hypothetical protein